MILLLYLKIFIRQTENGILNEDINRKKKPEKSCLGNFVLFFEYSDLKKKSIIAFVKMTNISLCCWLKLVSKK